MKNNNRKNTMKKNNKNKHENQSKYNNTTFFFRTISFLKQNSHTVTATFLEAYEYNRFQH